MPPKNIKRNNVFGQRNLQRQPTDPAISVLKGTNVSKTSSAKDQSEGTYNLLTCLACAQQHDIDFIGISWIDAQGILGRGGQAAVSQTVASVDTTLAFKRPDSTGIGSWASQVVTSQKEKLANAYRAIASEILVLGEPEIRLHPNIIKLIAISWEIQKVVGFWFFNKTLRVWPILVFEKAFFGNLAEFMDSNEGKTCELDSRVKFCLQIASAITVTHRKGIIHGDIKPGNVLVCKEEGQPVTKLADFGYAAFASNKHITIAGTLYWRAPEISSRKDHSLEQAKLADVFSFGILCLWIIFYEQLVEEGKELLSSDYAGWQHSFKRLLGLASPLGPDERLLAKHNTPNASRNTMKALAMKLVDNMSDEIWKKKLQELFELTLEADDDSRARLFKSKTVSEFEYIMRFLKGEISGNAHLSEAETRSDITGCHRSRHSSAAVFSKPSSFQVYKSLQGLCQADFRVREFIFRCLEKEYSDTKRAIRKSKGAAKQALRSNAASLALQVAFCKKIGFGTIQDPSITATYLEEAEEWRKRANLEHTIDKSSLQFQIDQSRKPQRPSNKTLRKLYDTGIIQPIHQALEFRTSPPAVQEIISKSRQEEIDALESELGATHPAILTLKWSLSALLAQSFDPLVSIEFLHGMVKSLEAEQRRQTVDRNNRDIVITKAYRLMSLMNLGLQAAETIEKQAGEINSALTELGESDHVVAIMIYGTLADCLAAQGRFRESDGLFQRAKLGTIDKFGLKHPNTVLMLTKESDRLIRQGRGSEAIDSTKDALKRLEKLVENDSMEIMPLRDKLAFLLVMAGKYPEAKEVIEETNKILEIKLPKFHPAKFAPAINLAMISGNYKEAARIGKQILTGLAGQGEPWPPPEEVKFDITKSPVLMELIEDNAKDPIQPYPNPKIFPIDPKVMEVLCNAVIFMQADAVSEVRRKNNREADRIFFEASNHLKTLLQYIDEGMGPEPWIGLHKVGGPNGSAMLRAMDEERTPMVELLARLGDKGVRDGVHYNKAITAARDLNLPKILAVLEEHRDLCGTEPDADAPLAFQENADLEAWIAGCWKGAYLYSNGGPRKDPKGHFTLNLTPTRAGVQSSDRIKVLGRGRNDVGNLEIRGDAWTSGKVVVRVSIAGNGENDGWQYVGFLDQERCAFGGYWGFAGTEREHCLGTFFFFKCDDGESDVDREASGSSSS